MLDQGEQDDKIIGVHADDPGRFHQIVFVKNAVTQERTSLANFFHFILQSTVTTQTFLSFLHIVC